MSPSGSTRRLLAGHQRSLLDHPSLQPALLLVSAQRLLGGAIRLGIKGARRARPSGSPAPLAAASSPPAATAASPATAPTASATATPASATASPPAPSAASPATALGSPVAPVTPTALAGPAALASPSPATSPLTQASPLTVASPMASVSFTAASPSPLASPAAGPTASPTASPAAGPAADAVAFPRASPAAAFGSPAAFPAADPAAGPAAAFGSPSMPPVGTRMAAVARAWARAAQSSSKKAQEAARGRPGSINLTAICNAPPAAPPRCPVLSEEGLGGGELAGRGEYGQVRRRILEGQGPVAVKWGTGRLDGHGSVEYEAGVLLDIRSRHVVSCVARLHNSRGQCTALVMPAAETSLDRIIDRNYCQLTQVHVIDIMGQIAAGMADIHAAGWVHFDLKPSNVLIDKGVDAAGKRVLVAKVCDLGLALRSSGLTTYDAAWCCTLSTKGPELFVGRGFKASDVFSWGATAAMLLRGDPSGVALYGAGADFRTAVLSGQRPELPRLCLTTLSELIISAMHPDPAARPSAAELHEKLTALKADAGLMAGLSRFTLPELWT